jgi:hypothetical protein
MSLYDLAVIFKLTSGDTIVCQVLSDTDKNMLVRDPVQVNTISVSTVDGIRSSTYYSPWFLGASSRVHMIRKDHVLSAAIPNDEIKEQYSEIVSHHFETESKDPSIKQKASKSFKNPWDDLNFKIDPKERFNS